MESKKCKSCKKVSTCLYTCNRCKKIHVCATCDNTSELLRWVEPEENKEEYVCSKCIIKLKLRDWDE